MPIPGERPKGDPPAMGETRSERMREGLGQRRAMELSGVEFRAVEGQERTFELSFSSEEPVCRWWGVEILSHEASAPNLSRLNDGGVLLYNHRTDIGSVLGPVNKAWLDAKSRKCRAIVTFDSDEDAERVFQKVQSGTLRNVSFMYSLDAIEEIKAGSKSSSGRFTGPCEVITAWTAYEVTICPVPADASVGVGRAAGVAQNNSPEGQEVAMPGRVQSPVALGEQQEPVAEPGVRQIEGQEPVLRQAQDAQVAPAAPVAAPAAPAAEPVRAAEDTPEQVAQRAIVVERQRVSDIRTVCSEFGFDSTVYDATGRTVDQVRAAVLEELRAQRPPIAGGGVRVGDGPQDHLRAAAPHAMLMRAGYTPDQLRQAGIETPHQMAAQLRGMGLQALLRECATLAGRSDANRVDIDVLMRDMFTPDSAFVSILDNTVGAAMMIGHRGAQTTFQEWVRIGQNPNFKATPKFRLSEAGEPSKITQSGEFTRDEMSDEGVSTKIDTYGKSWSITRKAIIDDNLGIITEIPAAYAMAAMRKINADVYGILNTNPAIFDGKVLFIADHGNLAAAGSAPTVLTLSAGRAAMRKQKGLRSLQALNISPAYMIVGVDIETPAQQLVGSSADPASMHVGVPNPFQSLRVFADAAITDTDSWHLVGSPQQFDTIEVTTLNGNLTPIIESRVGFSILGMEWRLYIDYGVTVMDYRALYKNPGAAAE